MFQPRELDGVKSKEMDGFLSGYYEEMFKMRSRTFFTRRHMNISSEILHSDAEYASNAKRKNYIIYFSSMTIKLADEISIERCAYLPAYQ